MCAALYLIYLYQTSKMCFVLCLCVCVSLMCPNARIWIELSCVVHISKYVIKLDALLLSFVYYVVFSRIYDV